MSPAEYGAASMLTTTSVLLVAILAAPLDALVFRTAPRGGDDAPGILRVAGLYCYFLFPTVAMAIAAGFAVYVAVFLSVPGKFWAIEIVAIGFQPAMTVFALPMVKSIQDLRRFVWLASTSIVTLAVLKLVFIVILRLSLLGWVLADLISAITSALLAMLLVRPPRADVSPLHVKAAARFAVPLIPHQASYWMITSLTRPALATVSTLAQVGLLSLGLNVASTVTMAVTEINRAVQPRYSQETFPAPTTTTFGPVRWQAILAIAVPAGTAAAFALVGQWVFPHTYWPAFSLTGVLLIGQCAYGLYPVAINYLVLTAGIPKYSVLATGTGAIVILASVFIFGREYGALGIAFATTVGYSIMAVVAVMLTRLAKLDIRWRSWARCWPELATGAAALGCGVIALAYPVGSNVSRSLGLVDLLLLIGVAMLIRHNRSDQLEQHPRGAQ